MTVCNMAIEGGARAGMIAPDETTFAYLQGRPYAPRGADWHKAIAFWRTLHTDLDAIYDKVLVVRIDDIAPDLSLDGCLPTLKEKIHSLLSTTRYQ